MRTVIALLISLCAGARAFAPATSRPPPRLAPATSRPRLAPLHAENPVRKYGGSVVLGLLGLQSFRDLVGEVPKLGSENADYFGTAIDVGFVAFAATTLANQLGATAVEPSVSLAGLDCKVTLSVGREDGTWMDKEWAASGARLLLPLSCRFTDEIVDLGFPGEEALGGRFCRKIECSGGSFVGKSGTENVVVENGGWATAPTGRLGESAVRFFLDFPSGAARNDVSIPAGRVFFSNVCFDETTEAEIPASEVVDGPAGVRILAGGGLTIKKNTLLNLWGALGDVNLILGRFSLGAAKDADD